MIENIGYLLILIILSGFFSASEIAIFSLSRARLKSLEKSGLKNVKNLVKLKSNPQRLLINILIGNNLVNIAASSMSAIIAYEYFGTAGPAIATGVLTVLILVFGEIGPKTFASSRAEVFSLAVTPYLVFIDKVFRPVAILFELFNRFSIKAFSRGATSNSVTEEELKALAEIGVQEGVVDHDEKEMIKRVLEFDDISAEDVMTVRSEIFALPAEMTVAQALPEINDSHHSRIPIYETSIDQIVGIIYLPDILKEFTENGGGTPLSKLSRKPFFIPKQRKIDDIFKDFQRRRSHIAIILDEQGLTLGLVTMEDLLEELVGEIMDESDIDEFLVKRINKKSILVDAGIEVKEVSHYLNVHIADDPYKSISEVFLEKFGRIPKAGDHLVIGRIKMVIEKASDRRIEKIRVIKE